MIILKTKDPQSRLDYSFDIQDWLNTGDTIASVEWILDPGITIGIDTYAPWNTDTGAFCWISDGTLGEVYNVTCRITTVGGRIDDFSFQLSIEST